MQQNSGEQVVLFSPGLLGSGGYGGWPGGGELSAVPLVFPEVDAKRAKTRKERATGNNDAGPAEISVDESGEMEYSLGTGLSWGEGAKGKLQRKERKPQQKDDADGVSSDGEGKGGQKRKRREIETAVLWTEEMVKFLFETYDDVHRRLYIESRGKVKNQKKWDPIIRTMQERFGREFTKNQCESKYWKVRRECTKYKLRLDKRAHLESDLYAGKGVRELLKPKFFDVWLGVAGANSAPMPDIEVSSSSGGEEMSPERLATSRGVDEEAHAEGHQHASSSCAIVREMQHVIRVQLEASEKREEALNIRAELTMELLRQHMDRMERTGLSVDDARQRQLLMIEGVDNKLDRLVNGLSALNGNIGAIIGRLASMHRSA